MDKEVRILTQEQLDAYVIWAHNASTMKSMHPVMYDKWLGINPCPLPPPVKVLDEKRYKNTQHASENTDYYNGFEAGYDACLSDLGLK